MHLFEFSETFVAVVDLESFSKAAKKLKIAPSVVTRRINLLEEQLQVQLLIRTTRRVSVTNAGEMFYKQMQVLSSGWQEACASIQTEVQVPTGKLRVAIVDPLADVLRGDVLEFARLYPEVRLEYYKVLHRVNLLADDIDIVIGPESILYDTDNIIGRSIAMAYCKLYASPVYLKKHGIPKSLNDLKKHRNILWGRYEQNNSYWRFESEIKTKPALIFNDCQLLIKAAVEGDGIVLMPQSVCQQELSENKIIPVLTQFKTMPTELHVFYVKRRFMPINIRLFVDCIIKRNKAVLKQ
jgi:DNA-binding transcriptional LysR family regulator